MNGDFGMKRVNRLVALLLVTVMMLSSCSVLGGEGEDGSIFESIGDWFSGLFGGESSGGELDASNAKKRYEEIMIIDASVSMQTMVNGFTRFERAIDMMDDAAEVAYDEGKRVTVIVAAKEAYILARAIEYSENDKLFEALMNLKHDADSITYGDPDMNGALELVESVTIDPELTSVTLYTDTTYGDTGNVKIRDVIYETEWNAAILDVRAELVGDFYRIVVDVASYGRDELLYVGCRVESDSFDGGYEIVETAVECVDGQITTLVFGYDPEEASDVVEFNDYKSLYVYVSAAGEDSLNCDNDFFQFFTDFNIF